MLSEPKFVTRHPQPFAAIRLTLTQPEIPDKAPPLIGELHGWLAAHGIAPAGAPFFNYTRMGSGETMEMEVGVPTPAEATGDGRVVTGTIPGGRFATIRYTGPYDGIVEAHTALEQWLQGKGEARPAGAAGKGRYDASLLEIYWTDPEVEPDPAKWVTDIAFRLGD